jgi:gas vesicle protein
MARSGGGCGVAWLALLVSLVALWFSWQAYQRTGGELPWLSQKVEVGGPSSPSSSTWKEDLARARERLLGHREDVKSERNLSQVEQEVADVRSRLKRTFGETGSEARERWSGVDADLQRLQAELRNKSARALETLDETIDKMKRAEKPQPPL